MIHSLKHIQQNCLSSKTESKDGYKHNAGQNPSVKQNYFFFKIVNNSVKDQEKPKEVYIQNKKGTGNHLRK